MLGVVAAVWLAGVIEPLAFHGDFTRWLNETWNLRYDQRNNIVIAFALGLADYLQATHDVPATAEGRRELEEAARSVTWIGLTVLGAERGGAGDDEGVVEFVARSLDGGHVVELHERSTFRRKDGRWLYVDGVCRVTRSRADRKVGRRT